MLGEGAMIRPLRLQPWCLGVVAAVFAGCTEPKKIEGFPPEYAGIGVELTMVEGQLIIVRCLEGGPAAELDLLAGDKLTAINGKMTQGVPLGALVSMLRGPAGSQLTLSVDRGGRLFTMMLRREKMAKRGEVYRPAG